MQEQNGVATPDLEVVHTRAIDGGKPRHRLSVTCARHGYLHSMVRGLKSMESRSSHKLDQVASVREGLENIGEHVPQRDSTRQMIEISLIIPAYNERQLLPHLLSTVDEARGRFLGGAGAVEVIVADNASTDGTAKIAADRGCLVVPVARRLIAAARNGGARAAQGEILCFVDADMRIHPETFNRVSALLSQGNVVAGATGVRLERWSVGIALTYAAMIPLVLLTGIDTGVVFCRRDDFDAIGGYDERRDFAEDVVFLWALRRLGKTRGQRLSRLPEIRALASMRKFDQYGDWHFFTRLMPLCVPALLWPSAQSRFARRYWYGDDR